MRHILARLTRTPTVSWTASQLVELQICLSEQMRLHERRFKSGALVGVKPSTLCYKRAKSGMRKRLR